MLFLVKYAKCPSIPKRGKNLLQDLLLLNPQMLSKINNPQRLNSHHMQSALIVEILYMTAPLFLRLPLQAQEEDMAFSVVAVEQFF